jgi:hypothetical protein
VQSAVVHDPLRTSVLSEPPGWASVLYRTAPDCGLIQRFNCELMDDKERQMLLDRIKRLLRRLGS